MNQRPDQRVLELMAACEQAVAARRETDALRAFRAAAALMPEHPLVLHEQARRALLEGDAESAVATLERVVQAAPRHPPFWMTLAAALRVLARHDDELNALERVLALEPLFPLALLQKGAVLDRMGKRRTAVKVYANALQALGAEGMRVPAFQSLAAQAQKRVAEGAQELGAYLDQSMKPVMVEQGQQGSLRFARCMDLLVGRKRMYWPSPTFMLVPFLRHFEFFDRATFPWLDEIEASYPVIRDELVALLAEDEAGVEPYVQYGAGVPLAQWHELNQSRRWGAYFLWKEGQRLEDHIARAPKTAAALASAPQIDVTGFAPTVFFSMLEPKTRIPPHHGVTNARAIVHLPLVVPAGCGFRVGSDTREWRPGEGWVFDDTIEHEAWNGSDERRAILIFDIWNPELTAGERQLVRESTRVLADYYRAEGTPDFML